MNRSTFARPYAIAALALLGIARAEPASALERMSDAHQNALRANCKWDYMSNCMMADPSSGEAFQCLRRNLPKLSPACQKAVRAVPPPKKP
jgi:hypothetical protein